MSKKRHSVLALSAVLLLAALAAPGAVAAADGSETAETAIDEGSAFIVELDPDGDARVTLVLTYDLADEDDEAAFDGLRDRPENVTARFDDRMSGIADRTAAETDREMTVSDVRADIESGDEVGVVRLSASWTNLAAVEGDRLVVSEPFASEFRTDRAFVLVAPDGYAVSETAVPADDIEGDTAEWSSGTDLSGFSVTATASESTATAGPDTDDSVPTPFAVPLALVTVALLGYAGWRRT